MKRRAYIVGFGAIVTPISSGCLNRSDQNDENAPTTENNSSTENTPEETEKNNERTPTTENNSSTGNMSKSTGNSECSFRVSIIEEIPDGVTVEDANEQLLEFDVIRYAFEHATDPEADHNTVTGRSGDYETFNVFAESDQRFEEVQTALDDFEMNRDDDYPPGVYLKYDGTVIAIVAACPT